jgi:predicted DsbA family dithiol-disulfide isomerase
MSNRVISKMTNFNIDIVSDVVCPWCYIGHTRLSRAIANHKNSYPDDTFKLNYKPFYLAPPPQLKSNSIPPFPVESRPRKEVYAEKFGPERVQQINARMAQVSASEGLNFKFGGKTGVSRNGHRLVHYAQNHGGEEAQNRAMLGLWRRYFEEEVDITELDVLVETGVEADLGSADEIKKYLESGADGKEVDELAEEARHKGINGVPHYEIQGRWEVSGAQDPVAFESLFKRWKNMETKEKGTGTL